MMPLEKMPKRENLFGLPYNPISFDDALALLLATAKKPFFRPLSVFTPNVQHFYLYNKLPTFRAAYNACDLSLLDGMPLVWVCRLLGNSNVERIAGSDLFVTLLPVAINEGLKVCILGGDPGVADKAVEVLCGTSNRNGNVFTLAPPRGFEKNVGLNETIIFDINAKSPDFLFVALGAPKQELWIQSNLTHLRAKVVIGVGASVDFVAGVQKRAPVWMQGCGLEWLFRFATGPWRIKKRYIVTNSYFVIYLMRKMLTRLLCFRKHSVAADSLTSGKIKLFGYLLDNLTIDEAISRVDEFIHSDRLHVMTCINAAKVIHAQKNELLRKCILESDMVVADGMSLIWSSRLLGCPLKQRIAGCDFFQKLIAYGQMREYRFYLLGATEDVITKLKKSLEFRYPAIKIAGVHNGSFNTTEERQIVDLINASGANVLFLGMPTPKKEEFVERNRHLFTNVRFILGVGGSFDIFAGITARAPLWMQHCGLEWLFRFLQEPRRMWKRYSLINILFIITVMRELLKVKLGKAAKGDPR